MKKVPSKNFFLNRYNKKNEKPGNKNGKIGINDDRFVSSLSYLKIETAQVLYFIKF